MIYILLILDVSLFPPGKETHFQALVQWNRAANQGVVDARVKVGDYHYYGLGTRSDQRRAASYYQKAETEQSAIAMFNLGYMHEFGIGLPQVRSRFYYCVID